MPCYFPENCGGNGHHTLFVKERLPEVLHLLYLVPLNSMRSQSIHLVGDDGESQTDGDERVLPGYVGCHEGLDPT